MNGASGWGCFLEAFPGSDGQHPLVEEASTKKGLVLLSVIWSRAFCFRLRYSFDLVLLGVLFGIRARVPRREASSWNRFSKQEVAFNQNVVFLKAIFKIGTRVPDKESIFSLKRQFSGTLFIFYDDCLVYGSPHWYPVGTACCDWSRFWGLLPGCCANGVTGCFFAGLL